ncbi:hypothetical protein DICPUDRAFT_55591 [Dictyostelium purpureum]|uniref:protein-tyrosine-phosphatase n=1 Tax=Dictyostelium purpureum TaxID=5786 RepID=F0ZMS0_DICPU|nr:uncharacterized protein DICPUDRAFT_55591 [Dictyostelium purpureum]EGC34760.1 hypothetical protein DICPUDRAFT_55591 [Dictyostelium purpureum]|eukprot:XP_003288722.1 hypothetical protein DICPUDRAFT_55591 [Dictyostelium purpureum]
MNRDTKDLQRMEKLGITHIVSCAGSVASPERYKIAVEHFEDEEDVDITEKIDKVFWFIEKASSQRDSRVLVHCLAGKSRSVSLVLGFILKHGFLSLEQTFYSVQFKRPEIRPNNGFMNQLLDLELKIRGVESFSRVKKEWQSIVKSPPNRSKISDLSALRGSSPKRVKQLSAKITATITEFTSIYLNEETLKLLYQQHLASTHQTQLYEYTFFCKEVQQYLSTTTNKAQEFTKVNHFVDWSDIVKYLEDSIESLVKYNCIDQ